MRRCERRCEDEKVWEKMWRWEGVREDVKMRRCERRVWRWEGVREDVKMRRCERRCEYEKVWEKMWRWEGVKDEKMRYRPPLLEEPCAQTLSGKMGASGTWKMMEIAWKYLKKYGTSMELPSTAWHCWGKGWNNTIRDGFFGADQSQWPPAINGRLMSFGITIGKLHGNMVWPMWTLWTYNRTIYIFYYHNVYYIYSYYYGNHINILW